MKVVAAAAGFLVALVVGVAPASAATNLIKNGGFEKPVVPSGSYQLFGTGSSFVHWDVVGASGNVAIVSGTFTQNGFSFPAKAGAQFLDLTGTSNSATGVAQTVATTPGAQYTLSFAVGNVVDPGGIFGTTSTVDVLIDGTQVMAATNSRGTGSTTMVWKRFTTTLTASSSSTTIALINGDPPNDTANALDVVKLVAA
jgi:hypothetical protein